MDRNDSRTNIRVQLFRLWKQHKRKSVDEYLFLFEEWEVNWVEDELRFHKGTNRVATVKDDQIFLDENIQTYMDLPINFLSKHMAHKLNL